MKTAKRNHTAGKRQESGLGYLMTAPAVLILVGLGIYPIGYTLWLSLYKLQLIQSENRFIGLAHYIEIFASVDFWRSIGLTFYFTVVSLAFQMALGLSVSLLLDRPFRGRGIVRAIVLVPWSVPTIVNASLWGWIYNAGYGALNKLLLQLGVVSKGIVWLGSAGLSMNMVILADSWRVLPLYVILILAALQTLPVSAIEATHIDGAGFWRRLLHVYLPLLQPMLLVVLVLRTIQAFRVFDIIYVLTQGGPANSTTVISFYAYYQTFKYLNFGYGSAVAVIIALFTVLLALTYMRLLRSEEND